ncbi:MAG: hypothetical protein F4186_08975 [Boseongicola sp. SB0676_bin_33]|nr:hypothetical protein [Boseongicola sp. SB0676_bin_33]
MLHYARAARIKRHGPFQMTCGLNFEAVHGDRDRDFIHIHHPLAQAQGEGKSVLERISFPSARTAAACSTPKESTSRRWAWET